MTRETWVTMETEDEGRAVRHARIEERRTWRERLLSLPWRPWRARRLVYECDFVSPPDDVQFYYTRAPWWRRLWMRLRARFHPPLYESLGGWISTETMESEP